MNLNPFRAAIEAALPPDPNRPARLLNPGETLADATARRWGIPAGLHTVDPLDVPHPVNRRARRAARKRPEVLASHSRKLTAVPQVSE